jgi:hypothetical protein
VLSKSIMPNWLFATLMTVPVRIAGIVVVAVGLGMGVLAFGCNGVGGIDSGAPGAAVPLPASFPQPQKKRTHAAMAVTRRIISLRRVDCTAG